MGEGNPGLLGFEIVLVPEPGDGVGALLAICVQREPSTCQGVEVATFGRGMRCC